MGIGAKFIVLAAMFFCHIFDDYYLQGILANLKQKDWWKEHAPQTMYNQDYLIALVTHAFSWSFSISIPLITASILKGGNDSVYLAISCAYPINTVIHAFVDNLKANDRLINLMTDQSIHWVQVLLTWVAVIDSI